MHPAIEHHRDQIAQLCRRFGVRRLEVFGSAARGMDFDPATSDADFLVTFEPRGGDEVGGFSAWAQLDQFSKALEAILGRPVDLVDRDTVERSRNPIRRRSILADAQAVYG